MIRAERTVLVLLAAGGSTRFGEGSKLAADLHGRPLGLHAAAALAAIPFLAHVAVTGADVPDFASYGFEVIANPDAARGQSSSLALGVARARDLGADALLIALADMPRITASHVHRLLAAADGPDAMVTSSDGARPMPPALFGRTHFAALGHLTGDAGARELLRTGRHIVADPAELVDVDTPADLAAVCAGRRSG